jgi:REP element-mobilizing transposase RayT
MKKPRQLSLFKKDLRFFGGALLEGKRKSLRPLSTRDPVHLVMRSTFAKGPDSFLAKRNRGGIDKYISIFAKRFQIRVYQRAIVGNHIHLVIRFPHRNQYKAFIKALSGKIAHHVMGEQSFKTFLHSRGSRRAMGFFVSRSLIFAGEKSPKGSGSFGLLRV